MTPMDEMSLAYEYIKFLLRVLLQGKNPKERNDNIFLRIKQNKKP